MEEESKSKASQFLVIKIPRPQNIERIMWICVVLVLSVVAFYQPLSSSVSCGADFVTGSLFGSEKASGNAIVETAPVAEPVKEAVTEPVKEVVKETPVAEEKVLSGLINLKIVRVNTVKKSEDWGKILSVDYEIDNERATDFYPWVKVFAYDESDSKEIKLTVKGEESSVSPIGSGEKLTGRVT